MRSLAPVIRVLLQNYSLVRHNLFQGEGAAADDVGTEVISPSLNFLSRNDGGSNLSQLIEERTCRGSHVNNKLGIAENLHIIEEITAYTVGRGFFLASLQRILNVLRRHLTALYILAVLEIHVISQSHGVAQSVVAHGVIRNQVRKYIGIIFIPDEKRIQHVVHNSTLIYSGVLGGIHGPGCGRHGNYQGTSIHRLSVLISDTDC